VIEAVRYSLLPQLYNSIRRRHQLRVMAR
jgi:hypothetical protein